MAQARVETADVVRRMTLACGHERTVNGETALAEHVGHFASKATMSKVDAWFADYARRTCKNCAPAIAAAGWKRMTSRYGGSHCEACGGTVGEGEDILWQRSGGSRVMHTRCFSRQQAEVIPAGHVTADCGHLIERALVMSASLGTACPDCYDRMSG